MDRSLADKFLSFLVRVFRLLVRHVKHRVSTAPPMDELEELPDDILGDVLSRMPLKTILQCRCVCKRWSRIIDDPRFRQSRSANKPDIFCLEYHHGCLDGTLAVHIMKDCEPRRFASSKIIEEFPQLFTYSLRNACNGMFYFEKSRAFEPSEYGLRDYVTERIVLNPIRKTIVKLLEAPGPSPMHRFKERYYEYNELGFDPCTDTYKLVRVFTDEDGADHPLATQVYDFRARMWRSRERCPDDLVLYSCLFASGAWNWSQRTVPGIVSFDFRRETFNLIPTPSNYAWDQNSMFEMGGVLAIIHGCTLVEHHDIWVLQDNKTKQWVKRWRISSTVYYHFSQFESKCIKGYHDGKLVAYDRWSESSRLWFYDMATEKLTWSTLHGQSPCRNNIFVAAPSLSDP